MLPSLCETRRHKSNFTAEGRGGGGAVRRSLHVRSWRRRAQAGAGSGAGVRRQRRRAAQSGAGRRRQRRRPAQAHFMDSPYHIKKQLTVDKN